MRSWGGRALSALFFIATLVYLVPVWLVFVNTFKGEVEANRFSLSLPETFVWTNYVKLFHDQPIFKAIFNGAYIGIVSVVLSVLCASMTAFAISRLQTRTTRFVYNLYLIGLVVPVAIIPTYLVLKETGLLNTYSGMIITFSAGWMPLTVFLYTGFFGSIPRELDEAAIVEGSGKWRLFFRVIFPLLKPVTTTVIVLNLTSAWNNVDMYLYFSPVKMWALPMSVFSYYGLYSHQWNMIFTDIVITLVPVVAVYAIAQKSIISGMTAGAVKG